MKMVELENILQESDNAIQKGIYFELSLNFVANEQIKIIEEENKLLEKDLNAELLKSLELKVKILIK